MLARTMSRMFASTSISQQASLFDTLEFPSFVRKIFDDSSFVEPTPIQAQAWPLALSGKDVIGIAQTGSGKTLAYAIPSLMHNIKEKNNNLRTTRKQPPTSMIVLPTRELCKQVSEVYCKYAFSIGMKIATVYGGDNKSYQIHQISPGIHTVIGTPGRMLDLMNQEILDVSHVNFLVLDEADLMLDMGFEDQVKRLVATTKEKRQTLMFTATWPREIQSLASEFLTNPSKITIGETDLTMNENISHKFLFASDQMKNHAILDMLTQDPDGKVLIFTNTKRDADHLQEFLHGNKIKSEALHSDKSQLIRNMIIREFRNNSIKIMIATDVASRGLDIKDVGKVINHSMPQNFDDYIHRVGRTARAGKKGVAVNFVNYKANKVCLKKLKAALLKLGHSVPKEMNDIINAQD